MMFFKMLQNLQELLLKACSVIKEKTLAQVYSYEFCTIFKDTSFNRTTLVAPSNGSYDFLELTVTVRNMCFSKEKSKDINYRNFGCS